MRCRGGVSVMTAEIVAGMVPVIVVVAHPEDHADDLVARINKIVQVWNKVLGRRALAIPASWR
jgi:hypothetical protein